MDSDLARKLRKRICDHLAVAVRGVFGSQVYEAARFIQTLTSPARGVTSPQKLDPNLVHSVCRVMRAVDTSTADHAELLRAFNLLYDLADKQPVFKCEEFVQLITSWLMQTDTWMNDGVGYNELDGKLMAMIQKLSKGHTVTKMKKRCFAALAVWHVRAPQLIYVAKRRSILERFTNRLDSAHKRSQRVQALVVLLHGPCADMSLLGLARGVPVPAQPTFCAGQTCIIRTEDDTSNRNQAVTMINEKMNLSGAKPPPAKGRAIDELCALVVAMAAHAPAVVSDRTLPGFVQDRYADTGYCIAAMHAVYILLGDSVAAVHMERLGMTCVVGVLETVLKGISLSPTKQLFDVSEDSGEVELPVSVRDDRCISRSLDVIRSWLDIIKKSTPSADPPKISGKPRSDSTQSHKSVKASKENIETGIYALKCLPRARVLSETAIKCAARLLLHRNGDVALAASVCLRECVQMKDRSELVIAEVLSAGLEHGSWRTDALACTVLHELCILLQLPREKESLERRQQWQGTLFAYLTHGDASVRLLAMFAIQILCTPSSAAATAPAMGEASVLTALSSVLAPARQRLCTAVTQSLISPTTLASSGVIDISAAIHCDYTASTNANVYWGSVLVECAHRLGEDSACAAIVLAASEALVSIVTDGAMVQIPRVDHLGVTSWRDAYAVLFALGADARVTTVVADAADAGTAFVLGSCARGALHSFARLCESQTGLDKSVLRAALVQNALTDPITALAAATIVIQKLLQANDTLLAADIIQAFAFQLLSKEKYTWSSVWLKEARVQHMQSLQECVEQYPTPAAQTAREAAAQLIALDASVIGTESGLSQKDVEWLLELERAEYHVIAPVLRQRADDILVTCVNALYSGVKQGAVFEAITSAFFPNTAIEHKHTVGACMQARAPDSSAALMPVPANAIVLMLAAATMMLCSDSGSTRARAAVMLRLCAESLHVDQFCVEALRMSWMRVSAPFASQNAAIDVVHTAAAGCASVAADVVHEQLLRLCQHVDSGVQFLPKRIEVLVQWAAQQPQVEQQTLATESDDLSLLLLLTSKTMKQPLPAMPELWAAICSRGMVAARATQEILRYSGGEQFVEKWMAILSALFASAGEHVANALADVILHSSPADNAFRLATRAASALLCEKDQYFKPHFGLLAVAFSLTDDGAEPAAVAVPSWSLCALMASMQCQIPATLSWVESRTSALAPNGAECVVQNILDKAPRTTEGALMAAVMWATQDSGRLRAHLLVRQFAECRPLFDVRKVCAILCAHIGERLQVSDISAALQSLVTLQAVISRSEHLPGNLRNVLLWVAVSLLHSEVPSAVYSAGLSLLQPLLPMVDESAGVLCDLGSRLPLAQLGFDGAVNALIRGCTSSITLHPSAVLLPALASKRLMRSSSTDAPESLRAVIALLALFTRYERVVRELLVQMANGCDDADLAAALVAPDRAGYLARVCAAVAKCWLPQYARVCADILYLLAQVPSLRLSTQRATADLLRNVDAKSASDFLLLLMYLAKQETDQEIVLLLATISLEHDNHLQPAPSAPADVHSVACIGEVLVAAATLC
eukprot:TRINITY_DN1457_c0_g1_i1.p1 TRINITY_DN1457_c0_g1~~TRINITY_DN1457_c0_g1_i1.p1  ORF type:complete len:1762 (-),score=432.60 TRINITY_DN1457_c0_g1_i1:4213-8910(-)